MQHRHLLPDEIDQLLDGETGFGIAPLEAHVRECEQCRAELESERQLVEAVEGLPRLAPSPLFADRVMAEVHVYEPWDVAVRDAAAGWVQRLVPQSQPLRILAGASALTVGLALSVVCVWLGAHMEGVFFFGSLARARLRDTLIEQLGAAVSVLFGTRAVDTLGTAPPLMLLGLVGAFAVLVLLAGLAVRSVVSTSRRGRA
jgi:hypothetical protein